MWLNRLGGVVRDQMLRGRRELCCHDYSGGGRYERYADRHGLGSSHGCCERLRAWWCRSSRRRGRTTADNRRHLWIGLERRGQGLWGRLRNSHVLVAACCSILAIVHWSQAVVMTTFTC